MNVLIQNQTRSAFRINGQWLVFSLFFLVPFFYGLYTDHAWEDWFITYRASKNLALGNGLVFQPGERLHTFTSPLGTLIPAFLAWITDATSESLVLMFFRIFNCVLLGISGVLAWQIGQVIHSHKFSTIFLLTLLLIDPKITDNSINGMETAIMVFFLTLLIYALTLADGKRQKYYLIAGLAGIMWTRPDGFVYCTGLLAGVLIWGEKVRLTMPRQKWFRLILVSGLIAFLFYLPWLIWTTWYYGSPIPNTIVAKGLSGSRSIGEFLMSLLSFPVTAIISTKNKLHWIFSPPYPNISRWPLIIPILSKALSAIAILYWFLPKGNAWGKVFSLSAFISVFYLSMLEFAYPWYIPMATISCIYTVSIILDQAISYTKDKISFRQIIKWGAVAIVIIQVFTFFAVTELMHVQQEIVENQNRKQIGLWLKTAAKPNETVFMECLGYIGFYSGMKTLDYPGLSSKEVIEARKKLPVRKGYPAEFGQLIPVLKPDWIVLRDFEIEEINRQTDILQKEYQPVKLFDIQPAIQKYKGIPGFDYLFWDARFTVYHHTTTAGNLTDLVN